MLVTNRPRGFPLHDHERDTEAGQGSPFAPEGLAPARPPRATPDPFAAPARKPAPDTPTEPAAPPEATAGPDALVSPPAPAADELVAPREYLADPDADALVEPAAEEPAPERDFTVRRRAVPLAGPTLDDVVSRVWEGMRAEVPTPCPVCHTEVEPSMHGRCGACGSTLD